MSPTLSCDFQSCTSPNPPHLPSSFCNGAHTQLWLTSRHSSGHPACWRPKVQPGIIEADSSAIYDVRGGTRAGIFDRLSGVKKEVIEEGTHFLVPWLQKAVIFDVRTKPRNISTTTGSKDLQMVSLTLRVLHRPNVVQLPKIYQVRSALCHC